MVVAYHGSKSTQFVVGKTSCRKLVVTRKSFPQRDLIPILRTATSTSRVPPVAMFCTVHKILS